MWCYRKLLILSIPALKRWFLCAYMLDRLPDLRCKMDGAFSTCFYHPVLTAGQCRAAGQSLLFSVRGYTYHLQMTDSRSSSPSYLAWYRVKGIKLVPWDRTEYQTICAIAPFSRKQLIWHLVAWHHFCVTRLVLKPAALRTNFKIIIDFSMCRQIYFPCYRFI